jgi:hypothetical protein
MINELQMKPRKNPAPATHKEVLPPRRKITHAMEMDR